MLYTLEGWLNVDYILNHNLNLNIIIGGRAVGKTYGFLRYAVEHDVNIIFMRRSQIQLDMIASDDYSPYSVINEDLQISQPILFFKDTKNSYGIYHSEITEKGKTIPIGDCLGHGLALSTIKNLRGFNAQKAEWLLFDEFIPEPHEHEIHREYIAFQNAYETINRNRELKGRPALKAILLANANNMASDIILGLGLVPILDKMYKNEVEEYVDKERSIGIWVLQNSPISRKKQKTGLYQIAGEDFNAMALGNRFAIDDSLVKVQPLKEYAPISTIGGLVFYRHKSRNLYYVTTHVSGSPRAYPLTKLGVRTWKMDNGSVITALMRNRLYFETKYCQIVFTKSIL